MLRKIMFRGKDIHTGRWVDGDLTHTKGIKADGDKLTYDRVMVGGYEVVGNCFDNPELLKNDVI